MFRYPCGLRHSLALAFFVLVFASAAAAQEVQILRAEYGYGDRQVDVTPRLRELARADRSFRVGNDTFGVDPAPGRGKTLRIDARGPRGDTRTFEYREGSVVDRPQFSDWNGGGWNGPGREDLNQLTIFSAVYGASNRNIDVAARLESLVRDNRLNLTVSNSTLDIDPAPGTHKTLSVTYSVGGGAQRQSVVGEGNQLNIP